MINLRPYQQDLVRNIRDSINHGKHSVCAVLGCGGGKSVIAAEIARLATNRDNPVLFLVHRRELCDQIARTFNGQGVNPQLCDIGMVQTVTRRLARMREPKLIIQDECFPSGTLVDGIPIEKISVGMKIWSFDSNGVLSKQRVLKLYKNPAPALMVALTSKLGKLVCTLNHPIMTNKGWKQACEIKKGDTMYVCMPNMWRPKTAKNIQNMPCMLQKKNDFTEPYRSFATHERPQSNAESRNQIKNDRNVASYTSQTKSTRWKWQRSDGAASFAKQGTWVADRSSSQNGIFLKKSLQASYSLQNRCGQHIQKNSNRSRRSESLYSSTPTTRQEEGKILVEARVEDCQILQSASPQQSTRLCADGYVYNLDVENNHTYFANNFAVHNCHHALSDTYKRIYAYWPQAKLVGFTATPVRMNEGGLGPVFEELVESVSTKWLIDHHYLAPYKYYGVQLADASKLHTRHGDYCKEEVEQLMDQHAIFGATVENWQRIADGRQTIVYCSSVKTSQATAQEFLNYGITAAHLDGTTPEKIRQATVEQFRAGSIRVLCNVDLFGEGFDVPDCEAVVLLRPTKSLTLFIQQSMRSMRYKDGKTALILDHVGNYTRHGLPDDTHEWSLAAKKKKKKSSVLVKQCPQCFMVVHNTEAACPYCGYVFAPQERSETEVVDGVLLEEIKRRPYDDYKKAKTWDELRLFQQAKGYKFLWTVHKAVELGIDVPGKYRWMTYRMGGIRA